MQGRTAEQPARLQGYCCMLPLFMIIPLLQFQFADSPSTDWYIQNDNVMGGMSEGWLEWRESGLHWEGHTRLENNGGFSSIRSPWDRWDLREASEIRITCRGTGGPFKLVLNTSQLWYMPAAQAVFDVPAEWGTVVIPVKDLVWSQVGRSSQPPVNAAQELGAVLRVGLMKYDGTAQPFEVDLADLTIR